MTHVYSLAFHLDCYCTRARQLCCVSSAFSCHDQKNICSKQYMWYTPGKPPTIV